MLDSKRFAEMLLNTGTLHIRTDPPYEWATGMKLPVYCDTRMLYSHPAARNEILEGFLSAIRSLHIQPDCIAGTATGAIGWATLIADRLDLPMVYVRRTAKPHGLQKQIEGQTKPGMHTLVIEDVILTGDSGITTAEELRAQNELIVTDVLGIFTYGMDKALEHAQQAALKLHALTSFADVTEVALEQGSVQASMLRDMKDFNQDPEHWK